MSLTLGYLGLQSDLLLWQVVLLAVISLGVGVLGGFVGLALGSIRLPIMLLMGMSLPVAGGTNILVSTMSALVGSVRHLRSRRVDPRVALIMGVPSMLGAFVGGLYAEHVSEKPLIAVVGILVVWQGLDLITKAKQMTYPDNQTQLQEKNLSSKAVTSPRWHKARHPYINPKSTLEAGLGLGVGLLGGAVGLILGNLRLPAMLRILKMDPRIAAGTNLFVGFLTGSLGWTSHMIRGTVDYQVLVWMVLTGMLGTYFGARLTGRASLITLLRTMGWVLFLIGGLMFWQAISIA